ncbi:MAG: hypothetical protein COB10_09555 [Planctomycetota bacterium]|nr:MAG: hypothetical protein COB10_09555 [Planctomycetota bacterium]
MPPSPDLDSLWPRDTMPACSPPGTPVGECPWFLESGGGFRRKLCFAKWVESEVVPNVAQHLFEPSIELDGNSLPGGGKQPEIPYSQGPG